MEKKKGKNHSVQHTHPTERCWQGTGGHLQPKRTPTEEKALMPQSQKETLKGRTTQKTLIQANPKRLIQKTNFATTPNT